MNLIFLAAGNSTRFGSNKLLYRLNGKCMYRYGLKVVAALWQKGLLDTIVIVTQYEEIIYDIEAHFPYMKIVNNPHPEARRSTVQVRCSCRPHDAGTRSAGRKRISRL